MAGVLRGLVVVLGVVLWPGSLFLSWIAATPMGFGMSWSAYSLPGQVFFLAPLIVVPAAAVAGALKRRALEPCLIVLVAPVYQALYLIARHAF